MEKNNIDTSTLANYVRVRPSDKDKFAELVIRAKGAKRSMRQFSLDCGVNPSTLSRIVNQKTAGNSSDELVVAIAENADPESGVTFQMLMDAHGKVPKQINGKPNLSSSRQIEKAIQNIILRELLDRNYSIATPKGEITHNALKSRYRPDLAVITNAISENDPANESDLTKLWEFDFWLSPVNGMKQTSYAAMRIRQKILMTLGLYYIGEMKPAKMSFVITDAELFDLLVSSFDGITFNNLLSLILIDLENEKVQEEFIFPVNRRSEIPEVFFPLETEENEEDEDDNLNFDDALFYEGGGIL